MIMEDSKRVSILNHGRRAFGIKIIENNINRRSNDIFHSKNETLPINPRINIENKKRIMEITEKLIDDNLRSSSPYIRGKRNIDYVPKQLLTSDQSLNRSVTYNYDKEVFSKSINEIGKKLTNDEEKKIRKLKDDLFYEKISKTSFDLNEMSKNHYEKQKRNRLNQQEYLIQNATRSLIIEQENKKHVSLLTKTKVSVEDTSFDLNERSKSLINSRIQEKVNSRQKVIDKSSVALVTERSDKKENLIRKFENLNSSFCMKNTDHTREKYTIKYQPPIKKNNINSFSNNAPTSKQFEFIEEITMKTDIVFNDYKKISEKLYTDKQLSKSFIFDQITRSKTTRLPPVPKFSKSVIKK